MRDDTLTGALGRTVHNLYTCNLQVVYSFKTDCVLPDADDEAAGVVTGLAGLAEDD
jgi:hypothetical protein